MFCQFPRKDTVQFYLLKNLCWKTYDYKFYNFKIIVTYTAKGNLFVFFLLKLLSTGAPQMAVFCLGSGG